MKALITATAAATLLLAAPLAFADGRGGERWGPWGPQYKQQGWKHGHQKHWRGPVHVQQFYYPAPRVVVPAPVYVPVPVAVPVPAPYPYPSRPVNSVDIGFRIFF